MRTLVNLFILLIIIMLSLAGHVIGKERFKHSRSSSPNTINKGQPLKRLMVRPETREHLKGLIEKTRKQTSPQTVIFAGPDQKMKLPAAEAIARELKRSLLQIDTRRISSRYIGETEKNIGSIFRKAQTQGAILFFDEADALFGKRSKVSDAHDKYANIEVSYLLNRLETYKGLVIISTNNRSTVKILRSLRHHTLIAFPCPPTQNCR